ncbi:MAG: DUF2721 domain-containing protein [Pyrinomonadaceae bacterium]
MEPHVSSLNSTIAFLTAMITPVLLISATGTLVLSTSTRLGRVIDRVRVLETRLSELIDSGEKESVPLYNERLHVVFDLLDKVTTRARLLQRAMVIFYYGLGFFVLTSVSIGFVGLFDIYRWLPIAVGLIGISYLSIGCFLLMLEAKMATDTVNVEMDFTWSLAREVVPKDIVDAYPEGGIFGRNLSTAIIEVLTRNSAKRTRKLRRKIGDKQDG